MEQWQNLISGAIAARNVVTCIIEADNQENGEESIEIVWHLNHNKKSLESAYIDIYP